MSDIGTEHTRGVLRDELPYIAMLLVAFVGVAINDFTGKPIIIYWQLLAPAFALICIAAGWDSEGVDRTRLIRTQAIHWLACFVAMRLLFLPQVRGVLNDNATGLSLLSVLALSTFLAGLHGNAWRIALVGVLLALAVPAAAWLEQSALLLTVEALLVLLVAALFFWTRSRLRAKV